MVEADDYFTAQGVPVWLLAQVHDELIWEHRLDPRRDIDDLETIRTICETAHGYRLKVPLRFDPYFCDDWSQKGEGIHVELPEDMDEMTSESEEVLL